MGQTVSSQISQIVNNITTLVRGLDQVLGPAISGLLGMINDVLSAATAAVAKLTEMFQMNRARRQAREELGGTMGRGTRKADPAAVEARAQEIFEASKASAAAAAAATATQPPANQILPTGGDLSGGRGKTDEERKAEAIEKQRESAAKLLVSLQQKGQLEAASSEEQRRELELQFQKENLARQFPLLKEEELKKLKDQIDKNAKITEEKRKQLELEREAASQAEILDKLYENIGKTISSGIVDSLMQAKSVSEALSGVLNNVAHQMLQLGVNSLLKSIGGPLFSALPGFANGGRPPVGRPSIVGERGPELFVPDRAGTILPNGVGMGSTTITVNVSASETSADSSNGQGASLGKAIGLAVQLELIKQKRPGGLLATV